MSDINDIKDKVKQVVVKGLDVDTEEVKPESSLVNDLGADSLDAVELIMALEEAFNIEIPDDEAENMQTIQNIIDYIEKNKKA